MLLIFHTDKNDSKQEEFFQEEMVMEFQEEFGENVWVKLKMVGYSNESEGGPIYLDFPDLLPNEIVEEEIQASDGIFLQPGSISLASNEGTFYDVSKGLGRFGSQTDNVEMDLLLGRVHPDRNKFRIVVNAQRASKLIPNKINLNNISCVIEMFHGSELG